MPIGEAVELTILIVGGDIRDELGMQDFNVVSLVKVIGNDLPIAARLGSHIQHPEHVFDSM